MWNYNKNTKYTYISQLIRAIDKISTTWNKQKSNRMKYVPQLRNDLFVPGTIYNHSKFFKSSQ